LFTSKKHSFFVHTGIKTYDTALQTLTTECQFAHNSRTYCLTDYSGFKFSTVCTTM